MRLLLKILFFILAMFQTNICEAKIFVFGEVVTQIKFIENTIENKNEVTINSENDIAITCKSESDLVDYRNCVIDIEALSAKGVGSSTQYSVAYEMKLASSSYPGAYRGSHFLEANKALSATMATDARFASSMSQLGITIPRSPAGSILGKSPANWVWHHVVGEGIMQLVPKTQHAIGSSFWNTLHPGGVGGFSIWGK